MIHRANDISASTSSLPPIDDPFWTVVELQNYTELDCRIDQPAVLKICPIDICDGAERQPLDAQIGLASAYTVLTPNGNIPRTPVVYGWNGGLWTPLVHAGIWHSATYSALGVVPRLGVMSLFIVIPIGGHERPWKFIEKFGVGDPPPELFGEATEGCRIKLQCRRAAASLGGSTPFGPGMITFNYHCGWFTRIPDADSVRLGTDVQGDWRWVMLDWDASVRALEFANDRGYEYHDSQYSYTAFDTDDGHDRDLVGGTEEAVAETARQLRRAAWDYARRNPRPYDLLGHFEPNSNSFIGAAEVDAGFHVVPAVPIFDEHRNDEGQFAGWHYWQRVGRDWRQHSK